MKQIAKRPAVSRRRVPPQGKPIAEKGWLYGSYVFTFNGSGAPSSQLASFFDRNKRGSDPALGNLGPIWSNMPADGALPVGYQFESSHLAIELVDVSATKDFEVMLGIKAELAQISGVIWQQETQTTEYGPASRYPAPDLIASSALGTLGSGAQFGVPWISPSGTVRDCTPFRKLIRSGGAFSLQLATDLSTGADRANLAVAVRAALFGEWTIRRAVNA